MKKMFLIGIVLLIFSLIGFQIKDGTVMKNVFDCIGIVVLLLSLLGLFTLQKPKDEQENNNEV